MLAYVSDAVETKDGATRTQRGAKVPWLLRRFNLDPATGFGIFVPGLFVMAFGGAMTWHWIFNIGSAIMLTGMTYVVVAVMFTALKQRFERKSDVTSAAG